VWLATAFSDDASGAWAMMSSPGMVSRIIGSCANPVHRAGGAVRSSRRKNHTSRRRASHHCNADVPSGADGIFAMAATGGRGSFRFPMQADGGRLSEGWHLTRADFSPLEKRLCRRRIDGGAHDRRLVNAQAPCEEHRLLLHRIAFRRRALA
jgi:hypothetical protein